MRRKKVVDSHKLAIKQETELLKKDLREARDKITDLEKAGDEATVQAKAKKEKLKGDLAALQFRKTDLVEEFKAQGQKIFMKRFIRKVFDFDWTIFGPVIVGYAEDLKIEIAEDVKKKRVELAAKKAEQADKQGQDKQAQRD